MMGANRRAFIGLLLAMPVAAQDVTIPGAAPHTDGDSCGDRKARGKGQRSHA